MITRGIAHQFEKGGQGSGWRQCGSEAREDLNISNQDAHTAHSTFDARVFAPPPRSCDTVTSIYKHSMACADHAREQVRSIVLLSILLVQKGGVLSAIARGPWPCSEGRGFVWWLMLM